MSVFTSTSSQSFVFSRALLLLGVAAVPFVAAAQAVEPFSASSSVAETLPDAPMLQAVGAQPVAASNRPEPVEQPSLLGTPKRIVVDELHIITSPARLRSRDLIWLVPVAGATAASLATDTKAMRDVVSHDAGFNSSASTTSDVLRGVFIGGPVALFGAGEFLGNAKAREAGLLAGEAMVNGYVTSEGVKYITLRERPNLQNARGHFFQRKMQYPIRPSFPVTRSLPGPPQPCSPASIPSHGSKSASIRSQAASASPVF